MQATANKRCLTVGNTRKQVYMPGPAGPGIFFTGKQAFPAAFPRPFPDYELQVAMDTDFTEE